MECEHYKNSNVFLTKYFTKPDIGFILLRDNSENRIFENANGVVEANCYMNNISVILRSTSSQITYDSAVDVFESIVEYYTNKFKRRFETSPRIIKESFLKFFIYTSAPFTHKNYKFEKKVDVGICGESFSAPAYEFSFTVKFDDNLNPIRDVVQQTGSVFGTALTQPQPQPQVFGNVMTAPQNGTQPQAFGTQPFSSTWTSQYKLNPSIFGK